MTSKLFLFCAICLAGCANTDVLIDSYALEDQPSYFLYCGPDENRLDDIYVSSIFTREYDSSYISDIAIAETDEMGYLIDMDKNESGDIEGFVNIPHDSYSSCEDVKVTFLSEY